MGAVISSCCLNNGSISCHTRASGSSGLLLLSVSGMAGFVGSCATHHPLSEMRRKKRAFQPPSSPHCSQQSTWCTCDKTEFEVNVCFQTDDNHHHHRRFYEYYMVLWVWHPIILKKCDCCTQRFLMPPFFFFFSCGSRINLGFLAWGTLLWISLSHCWQCLSRGTGF